MLTREDNLDLALRHMMIALMRHNEGMTMQEAGETYLRYVKTLKRRPGQASDFKAAVARRMSSIWY